MYEQNYPSGQSAPTVDPEPAPNLTEGWLWRKAKITYDKGWYRLKDGELICQGGDRKKDEALGKVSGAVTTSEERLEFTLCAPLVTLETARLALPMPTLASRPTPARQTRSSRRAPSAFAPRARRSSTDGWPRVCCRRTSYSMYYSRGCAAGGSTGWLLHHADAILVFWSVCPCQSMQLSVSRNTRLTRDARGPRTRTRACVRVRCVGGKYMEQ